MKRRRILYLAAALGVVLLAGGAAAYFWAASGLDEARGFAEYALWPEARAALQRYLWLYPGEPTAHLLLAEALIKDETLATDEAGEDALAHLRAIPDEAPEGARARLQEGRVEFLVLHRPVRAERRLRRAAQLDPQTPEPYYLLWKLKDQTGRSHLAEPEFWKAYELGPDSAKPIRLREWYMSQFFPATANPFMDRLMGMVPRKASNAIDPEAFRFIRFRNAEPEAPLWYAALGRWFHQVEGDANFALETLDSGLGKMESPNSDPFYVATLVSILIELGQFDRADQCFQQWPQPQEGYEFWLTQGQVLQQIRSQFSEAAQAYDRALVDWPGPVDWRTMYRKADCLVRMRDQVGATRERARAKMLEGLMDEKYHQRLRLALGSLNDPEQVKVLVHFYREIGRPREAACWSEHVARLQSQAAGKPTEARGEKK